LNKITERILKVLKSIDYKFGKDTNDEEKLVAFNESSVANQTIYVLHQDKESLQANLDELNDILNETRKYDARHMNLIDYIKLKLRG
tara:strand:+ start:49 stop:309 length:261 start_codon:yes stop_codon:yes gene_type:complete